MADSFDPEALAIEYRRLGGKREVRIQGETIHMNTWKPELRAAELFWDEKIATLPQEQRNAVARCLAEILPR